ncbi:MAG TPA: hypothetical protein VFN67_31010 [Polyangiales bacterium]|nr:hypothetical protein [Polyangiales bacterium]
MLVAACSVDNRPGYGVLLQIDTDLATPKDLDRVQVVVTQSGRSLLEEFHAIGSAGEPPPIEIPIGYRGDSSPARFEITGSREGQTRVERLAIVPIPSSRWAILRVRLHYLCVGRSAAAGGEDCETGSTCVQGECAPATLAESDLPDYPSKESVATGGATSTRSVAGCFEVLSCFDNASEAQLESDCSFAINPAIGSEQLNVALRLSRGSVGTCGDSGCYIPFDKGSEGYTFEPGRVTLPAAVCERLRTAEGENVLAVMFSNSCPAKLPGVAVCDVSSNDSSDGQGVMTGDSVITGFVPESSVGPACDGGRIKSCGMCGTQERGCNDGNWGEFGACGHEGECAVNQTRACGTDGLQTCGGDCRWGECLGQKCQGIASRACERCGTQARTCENGIFNEWGACLDQGACSPGDTQTCGSQGTQACGGNCAWGPCGEQVCRGAPTEACGMCGSRSRECNPSSGEWSEFGECSGEGVCMPNDTRPCGRGGTQVCGGNCQWSAACTGQSCEGERSMACGNCGTRTRTCDMNTGTWSDWSACTGEGVCDPDDTRGCGRGGTQVCDGSCRWDDACTGQSCVGANRQNCGNCGVQTRVCDGATGSWSDWSDCSSEGACRPNAVRSCGSGGTQECGNDCQWQAECGGQICRGETSRACGDCGVQRRSCDSSTGRFSDWGACENQGRCAVGATRGCGSSGTQTCGENCEWNSACTGQVCAEPASRGCGNCGTQTSTCDPNTGRANWSTCMAEGQCAPGTTQGCGSGGVQVCGTDCRWSATCSMQICLAEAPTPQSCGRCGSREAMCDSSSGEWVFPMQCSNQGACTPGQSRRCGTANAGNQSCGDNCEWGECRIECTDPLIRPCGLCGTGMQLGTCDATTGRVTYEEMCRGGGACMPGTLQPCSTEAGSGSRTCSDQCTYPEACTVTTFECRDALDTPCGNCGVRSGACDTKTGLRACVEPLGACVPASTQDCSTAAGSGKQSCSGSCQWSACMLTSINCTEPLDTPCGNCGVRSGACDPLTGLRACVEPVGACVPESTQVCSTAAGSGSQACTGSCVWSECAITSRNCTEPRDTPCGNCGVRSGACDSMTGLRACVEPDGACMPEASEVCSTAAGSGNQSCGRDCRWGECQISTLNCTQPLDTPCGNCGMRMGECDGGTGLRACIEPVGACAPQSTMDCSTAAGDGKQTCSDSCLWSECMITAQNCLEPTTTPCGNCGVRSGACDPMTGVRACVEPETSVCRPLDRVDCSTDVGSGEQLCMNDCTWSGCMLTTLNCTEPLTTACGLCGLGTRSGECDTTTGVRACVEPSTSCTPRSFENCQIPYDGGVLAGTRVCTDNCAWTQCEPVVVN